MHAEHGSPEEHLKMRMVALHVFTFEIGCEYTPNMRATPSMNFGVPVSQALFQQL